MCTLPASNDAHLWVDWSTYHGLIDRLALQVHESGWAFDQILCLARGGLRPGDQLSRIFDRPLAVLSTRSYRGPTGPAGPARGSLDIGGAVTLPAGELAGDILLVDDLVDSGITLVRVVEHLRAHYPALGQLRTAVLWYKACSVMRPDYFVEYLPTNPWIHQPFESWDDLRPAELARRMRGTE